MTLAHRHTTICMSCFLSGGQHLDSCLDFATQPIPDPPTAIMEAPQFPAEAAAWDVGQLVTSTLVLTLGLGLVVLATFFRDEAASAVWSWLH